MWLFLVAFLELLSETKKWDTHQDLWLTSCIVTNTLLLTYGPHTDRHTCSHAAFYFWKYKECKSFWFSWFRLGFGFKISGWDAATTRSISFCPREARQCPVRTIMTLTWNSIGTCTMQRLGKQGEFSLLSKGEYWKIDFDIRNTFQIWTVRNFQISWDWMIIK